MKQTVQTLQVVISDNGYEVITNTGSASYNLDGIAFFKIGLVEHLPSKLKVTDARSLHGELEVGITPKPFAVLMEFAWPAEAGEGWYAAVRTGRPEENSFTMSGCRINYPENSHTVDGLRAGQDVSFTVTLHDGKGRKSKPIQFSGRSSDDAQDYLKYIDGDRVVTTPDGVAIIRNGEVFLKAALIEDGSTTAARVNDQLSEAVKEEIRKALRPGGLLHGR